MSNEMTKTQAKETLLQGFLPLEFSPNQPEVLLLNGMIYRIGRAYLLGNAHKAEQLHALLSEFFTEDEMRKYGPPLDDIYEKAYDGDEKANMARFIALVVTELSND